MFNSSAHCHASDEARWRSERTHDRAEHWPAQLDAIVSAHAASMQPRTICLTANAPNGGLGKNPARPQAG